MTDSVTNETVPRLRAENPNFAEGASSVVRAKLASGRLVRGSWGAVKPRHKPRDLWAERGRQEIRFSEAKQPRLHRIDMTNPGRNSSLRRLGDENPTRIGPAGLAVPVPAASPTAGPHTVCAAIKSPTHRRAVASRPAPRGRSGHRPPPPRPRPALRRGLLSPVSTFGVRNPQAQSAPGGSRQEGEDRAPSTTVDGDPP